MFLIESNIEDAIMECPQISEWIDIIREQILKKKIIDTKKIKIFYSYKFCVKKLDESDKEEFYEDMFDKSIKMSFEERKKFELSKIRIEATIIIDHFVMKNKISKNIIPECVLEIATEIIKIKMLLENSNEPGVYDSIPALSGVVGFEILESNKELSIDDLLEKISQSGIESLTPSEKNFLDRKSKDI